MKCPHKAVCKKFITVKKTSKFCTQKHTFFTAFFEFAKNAFCTLFIKVKTLSYSRTALIILFAISTHWNSNGNECETSFDKILEVQTLDLAIKTEALLKQHKIYNHKEISHLIDNIMKTIDSWQLTHNPLSRIAFTSLKKNIDRLEALLKTSAEKTTSEYSDQSTASQKPTDLLNSVVANDILVKPNKLYTVKTSNGNYTFSVVFSEKIAQIINQNRTDIRITKSMKALLTGPTGNWGESGIKKIKDQKNLFEIKIMGKKGVGNFRIGAFLYNGVYYIVGYTYQHIERHNIFLQGLKRALMQATQRRNQHIPSI